MPRSHRSSDRPRRVNRGGRSSVRIDSVVAVPVGPRVTSRSVAEVVDAIEAAPEPDDWCALAPMLVPVFQRVRPYHDDFPDPLRTMVPPGISITFAIDIGPALLHVTPEIAASWSVPLDEITARALQNVAARARAVPLSRVVRDAVGDVPVAVLQSGAGSASTFVLQPAELPRLFGTEPLLFIAPMRDLLVALPRDVDGAFALWLHAEFADPDPNCLAPIGFLYDRGSVVLEPLEREFATA